jgi:hypothetical protein
MKYRYSLRFSFLLGIAGLLLASCLGHSGAKTTLQVTVGNQSVPSSLEGLVSAAVAAVTIPDTVNTLEIDVQDNGGIIAAQVFTRDEVEATGTVSLAVPSGENLTVNATARNPQGLTVYTGQVTGVTLSGASASVSISMIPQTAALDAAFTVRLADMLGNAFTTVQPYYNNAGTVVVEVFTPQLVNDNLVMGTPVSSATTVITTTGTVSLNAYPLTNQLLMARVMTDDGTFALVGGTMIANLISGENGELTIKMGPPTPLNILRADTATAVSTWSVAVFEGGAYQTVASGTTDWVDPMTVAVPNSMNIFGRASDGSAAVPFRDMNVRVTINGTPQTYTFPADGSGNGPLRWAPKDVNF